MSLLAAGLVYFSRDGIRAWNFATREMFDGFIHFLDGECDIKCIINLYLGRKGYGFIVAIQNGVEVLCPLVKDLCALWDKGRIINAQESGQEIFWKTVDQTLL